MTAIKEPTNLVEAIRYFSDPERAFDFVLKLRWADGKVTCPRCSHGDTSFVSTRKIWKCKGCKRQFSLKVGTIFEDSPLGWDKWLPAVWLIANSKNSVSSHELARSLGVTQKSAWFMLHRIRDAMSTGTFHRMSGITEVDDTYIDGLAKNRKVRAQKITGTGGVDKTVVQGARNHDAGTGIAKVVPATDRATLQANVIDWVEPGSAVFTDEASAYKGLDKHYAHKTVNHSTGEYVVGDVHTNGIESYWSLLKRSVKGSQIHVAPVTLTAMSPSAPSPITTARSDLARLRLALIGTIGQRLTWAELTGRPDGSDVPGQPLPSGRRGATLPIPQTA
jgi:transposase-like protein